jgi:hypothetical protein
MPSAGDTAATCHDLADQLTDDRSPSSNNTNAALDHRVPKGVTMSTKPLAPVAVAVRTLPKTAARS